MKRRTQAVILILFITLFFTACATTSLSGRNNEAYETEKTEKTEPATEEMADLVFLTPKKSDIPPFYAKVRVPGVKSILYVYSDSEGETQFRVYGRLSDDTEEGFFPVTLKEDRIRTLYSMELENREIIKSADERPGAPRRDESKPAPESAIQPHWRKVPNYNNLYNIRDKDGKYQFRQWGSLGKNVGFYPANDVGVMIYGGIPDAVNIQGKWVAVRIMNPMTFAYEGPQTEETTTEEVIISYPDETPETWETETPSTSPPRTEPPRTEPPRTEPPETEPPVTEPPETEPPVTEPPVTEPPETEPPVTEPPVTEPPETEPPVTEPPNEDPSDEDL